MIKFTLWFIGTLWALKKQDRASLREAITRWQKWEQDKNTHKVDVKSIHHGIVNYLPMGAGYVLLVSQSQTQDEMKVDVEITFSSNLTNVQAVEILNSTKRTLDGKPNSVLTDFYK